MRASRLLLPVALLLSLSVAGCDDKKKKKSSDDDSASSADGKKDDEGRFKSAEGKYSIVFPYGAPKESTKPDSKGITWHDAKSDVGAYSVLWADYPDAKAAQASVDDYLAVMKAEIQEDKESTVDGNKGHEIKMKISDTATMWMRIFAADKRVFKVGAGTKNDKAKALKFLDSFKLEK